MMPREILIKMMDRDQVPVGKGRDWNWTRFGHGGTRVKALKSEGTRLVQGTTYVVINGNLINASTMDETLKI